MWNVLKMAALVTLVQVLFFGKSRKNAPATPERPRNKPRRARNSPQRARKRRPA